MDWSGPIPEFEPDLVDIPDTQCPFNHEQLRGLPRMDGINYLDGIQMYSQIIAML